MNDSWLFDRIRQVHIDFHMPEFPRNAVANFDAKQFVAELKHAHVNVIGAFTKCHFGNAFYNTAVGHKHRGLKGDFFGEVLEEAHQNDIKVIAYYSLATDEHAVKNNPDWYQVDENGQVRAGNGTVWNLPCINSPYREELVLPQIREITENYDIDGYLIDIPYNSGHKCFCMYCRRKFKQEYDMELTPDLLHSHPALVREFQVNSAIRCMQEIQYTVKCRKPHVQITCNGAWMMGEPEALNKTSDYGLWESQPAYGTFLCHSFKARHTRTLDVPVQIMTVRFTEDWGLMSCKTAEQLKYEFATIIANGGVLNVGDQVMIDGTLQSGAYDVIGEAFAFVEEREKYCTRAKSVKHMALITNHTTEWLWEKGEPAGLGAAKVLIEGHHQFDIYYNDDFGSLEGYKIVVLPESVQLSGQSLEKVRRFVEAGGLLVTEGKAAFDPEARNFALSDVLGLNFLEYAPYSFAYMSVNKDLWAGNALIPQLLEGEFIKATPAGAETLSYIQWPCGESVAPRSFRHRLPPPGDVSRFPAVSVNNYGKGKAIYIAAPIFKSYWDNNHFWLKNIVNNTIALYDDRKPFTVKASPAIEANMMEKDGKTYLHLVNFQSSHTGSRKIAYYDPIEKILPVHDIQVRVRKENVSKVTLQPAGIPLEFEEKDGLVAFTVPRIHIHEIVEME